MVAKNIFAAFLDLPDESPAILELIVLKIKTEEYKENLTLREFVLKL
ncbi:hypothetical protein [Leptospira interrogans]|nr:hypothetical protein [Leptospira interrogans]